MKLLTKDLEHRLTRAAEQRDDERELEDVRILAKFFNPSGAATWLISEYNPRDRLFYGYASLGFGPGFDEWGYISRDELESLRGPFGLGIERDLYFEPKSFAEARQQELGY